MKIYLVPEQTNLVLSILRTSGYTAVRFATSLEADEDTIVVTENISPEMSQRIKDMVKRIVREP